MSGDVVDLNECFVDSPPYRRQLAQCDGHLAELEHCLRGLLKGARAVIDTTQELVDRYTAFSESLIDLGRIKSNRPSKYAYQPFLGAGDLDSWSIGQHIMFLGEEMKRIEANRRSFIAQLETVFVEPLESLARTDLTGTRELKKRWEKCGGDFLHENSKFMARKSKDPTLADGAHELAAMRKEYHETSLEYVGRLNEVLAKEHMRISEAVLALFQSRGALGTSERAVFEELEPNLRALDNAVSAVPQAPPPALTRPKNRISMSLWTLERSAQKETILERCAPLYNPMLPSDDGASNSAHHLSLPASLPLPDSLSNILKSGYLYKRSSHAVRPVWSRRFFSLHDNVLEYYSLEVKNNSATVIIDLRLCTVKPLDLAERRHCFEIVSPVKTYTLQAENEKDLSDWMDIIQKSIHEAIRTGFIASPSPKTLAGAKAFPSRSTGNLEILSSYLNENTVERALKDETREEICRVAGNEACADCAAADPDWVSITLGVLVCIECSGIHRSLGVHRSKVRSLRLDYWEPEYVQIIKRLGNSLVQTVFEGRYEELACDTFYQKPTPESNHEEKEQWVIAKYQLLKFLQPPPSSPHLDHSPTIKAAIQGSDLARCLHWLASGADVNTVVDLLTGGTALHVAASAGRWETCTFLILWSADIHRADGRGWTVLHYMAGMETFSLTLLVSLLRKNLDMSLLDNEGNDAMSVAIEHGNGDFVTVLRMFEHDQRHTKVRSISALEANSCSEDSERETAGTVAAAQRHKSKSLRKLLRHYPKFYKRMTNPPRRRSSLGASPPSASSTLTTSMSQLGLFEKGAHRRSKSHDSVDAAGSDGDGDGDKDCSTFGE